VPVVVMIASALLAAILYGVGAAVEQRQAAGIPETAAGRPRLLVLLARQPLWVAGIGAQFGGFAAHAVALRYGPLAVVQMVVAGELIVAVLFVRHWARQPLSGKSWAAALTVALGVAAFLALAGPSGQRPEGGGISPAAGIADHDAWTQGRAVLAAVLLAAAAAGLLAAGLSVPGASASGRRRAMLLAVAAGLADSCMAVLTMVFARVAGHGLVALATSWTVYAVVIGGIGNLLLTQTAYQAGRPMITLPVISAVTPMASVAIGIGLLGETPRLGTEGLAAAAVVAVVTGLALASLARTASAPGGDAMVRSGEGATVGLEPAAAGSPPGPCGPDMDFPADNSLPETAGKL
jgi:drug/metabolite transporter (DMT)-like permease